MSYGMQQLRKAGNKIRDLDNAYAKFARGGMADNDPRIDEYATPLNKIMGADRARYIAEETGGADSWMGADSGTETVNPWTGERKTVVDDLGYAHTINDIAQMGGNIGVRYGLPAAGLTFAGKGLYDLTAMFGNGADYPEQGQLPI